MSWAHWGIFAIKNGYKTRLQMAETHEENPARKLLTGWRLILVTSANPKSKKQRHLIAVKRLALISQGQFVLMMSAIQNLWSLEKHDEKLNKFELRSPKASPQKVGDGGAVHKVHWTGLENGRTGPWAALKNKLMAKPIWHKVGDGGRPASRFRQLRHHGNVKEEKDSNAMIAVVPRVPRF